MHKIPDYSKLSPYQLVEVKELWANVAAQATTSSVFGIAANASEIADKIATEYIARFCPRR